jgi:hypothetical protein
LTLELHVTESVARSADRNERYGYLERLPSLFARKLRAGARDSCHPLMKAARVYLDVCLVHPFAEGNSRAALLWCTFRCLAGGIPPPAFRRIVGFELRPGQPLNYLAFSEVAAAAREAWGHDRSGHDNTLAQ